MKPSSSPLQFSINNFQSQIFLFVSLFVSRKRNLSSQGMRLYQISNPKSSISNSPIRSAKKLQKVTLISGQLSAFILPHSLERDEIPTRCWERLQQSFLSREASRRGKSAGFGAAIDRSLHRAERRAESPQTCGWGWRPLVPLRSAERVPSFSDPHSTIHNQQSTIHNSKFQIPDPYYPITFFPLS